MKIQPTHACNAMRHRMLAAAMQTAKESAAASVPVETHTRASEAGLSPTDPVTLPSAVTDPAAKTAPARDRANGVLRLLEDGHFRRAAALRLAAKFGGTLDPAALRPSWGSRRPYERLVGEHPSVQPRPFTAVDAAPAAAPADVTA